MMLILSRVKTTALHQHPYALRAFSLWISSPNHLHALVKNCALKFRLTGIRFGTHPQACPPPAGET